MLFDTYMEEALNDKFSFKEMVSDALHKPVEFLQEQWEKFKQDFNQYEPEWCRLINEKFKLDIKSFADVDKAESAIVQNQAIMEDVMYNENLQTFWNTVKSEAQAALFFWPILQLWLEFDKFAKGKEIDKRTVFVYGTFWAVLVVGKYIKGQYDANKEAKAEEERRSKLKKKIKPRIARSIKKV